jgi:mannose-6-phosphate isomerase-like protein (cupin superfamily)
VRKVNTNEIEDEPWEMAGKFRGIGKGISEHLGRNPDSLDLNERHPFDVEIQRIAPGETAYPYHSHSAQWEFYHVISGAGTVRDEGSTTKIVAGDAFIFHPGQAHQMTNDGAEDLVVYVVADNPIGESVHLPDSAKWVVRSPERKMLGEAPG